MVRASNACRSGLSKCFVKAVAKGEGITGDRGAEVCGVVERTRGFSGIEPIRKIMSVRASSGSNE